MVVGRMASFDEEASSGCCSSFPCGRITLFIILALYTVLGGLIFVAIEQPAELRRMQKHTIQRAEVVRMRFAYFIYKMQMQLIANLSSLTMELHDFCKLLDAEERDMNETYGALYRLSAVLQPLFSAHMTTTTKVCSLKCTVLIHSAHSDHHIADNGGSCA